MVTSNYFSNNLKSIKYARVLNALSPVKCSLSRNTFKQYLKIVVRFYLLLLWITIYYYKQLFLIWLFKLTFVLKD